MFTKVLIANRGEIACRVIRTVRQLGIRTIAVYSDADRDALHVELADEAHRIGPASARESYLNGALVLDAARRAGADAIHPGYGFLSENADFAEACAAAGIAFIGPPPAAIRAMGGKMAAKALMERAGVPVVPGYHGDDQDPARLAKEAARIGYPVLIKASAGGGGKGMKIVTSAGDFAAALASARREAQSAFGDDRVLLERYLADPRHVEVQVFADQSGNCISLAERDCSIQRRHQKVLEEAPAPDLPADIRKRMGEAAVAAARAVAYVGAGTVEFLYAPATRNFHFMEMNTRLQVEHPVTEMITGLDLVEWQFRVAAGEPLPLRQDEVATSGHAIEVRLYAEDPARDFLPQTGRLDHLAFPSPSPNIRIDTGVRAGDTISIHYDPMIAKLIVWDTDRAAAARRLSTALAATEVAGFATNLAFLARLAAHPAFRAGEVDTGFIARHHDALLPPTAPATPRILALAALGLLLDRRTSAATKAAASADPWSPWAASSGWRLNLPGLDLIDLREAATGESRNVTAHYLDGGWRLDLPGGASHIARGTLHDTHLTAEIEGTRTTAAWLRRGNQLTLLVEAETYQFTLPDPIAEASAGALAGGRLAAPMPGRVIALLVEAGASVTAGQPLAVLEAMKMEHTIKAPAAGTVEAFLYKVGDQIEEGVDLLTFRPEA